jgi:hypothetical protein
MNKVRPPTLILQAIGVYTGCQMMLQILKMAWSKTKSQPLLRGATVKARGAFGCCCDSEQEDEARIVARGSQPTAKIGRIWRGKRTPTPTKRSQRRGRMREQHVGG